MRYVNTHVKYRRIDLDQSRCATLIPGRSQNSPTSFAMRSLVGWRSNRLRKRIAANITKLHCASRQILTANVRFGSKSGHQGTFNQCPLCPQKQTLELSRAMSALCQKRTLRGVDIEQPLSLM